MPRSFRPNIPVHSFNKQKFFNPINNLHWMSFSSTDKIFSLEVFSEQLAQLHQSYHQSSLFERTIAYYSKTSEAERVALQQTYLKYINHDQYATIYPGFLHSNDIYSLRNQTEKIVSSCIKFARDLVIYQGMSEQLKQFMQDKYSDELFMYQSILATSLLNYATYYEDKRWQSIAECQPLYAECGIDYMYTNKSFHFAELQFSYQTYPHHIDILSSANFDLLDELMYGIKKPDYCVRRLSIIELYIELIAEHLSVASKDIHRCVIDAWAMTKHPCRNYKILAHQLKGAYRIFDEFDSRAVSYRHKLQDNDLILIFNQALLYLMDPHELFGSIIHEQLEHYPHLRVKGLYEDYMNQRTFLANSPIIDILNDKAIYALIPALYEYYQKEIFTGSISFPHPVWDRNNPFHADSQTIQSLKSHKDRYVICHRYLEAGDGIRIGKDTTQKMWDMFIDTYVLEKPYLFIFRDYIDMYPDISLRMYYAGIENAHCSNHQTSDVLLGRINPSGSLTDESYFFICYPDIAH